MSIPDFDYELEKSLGQFEYSVGLSPVTPSNRDAVAEAFKYGVEKENTRILALLEERADGSYLNIALYELRKLITNDQTAK